jgi:hypothetical protein
MKMKAKTTYTKQKRFVSRKTLLVMTIFAATFFLMPTVVLSANLSVSVSPDGQSEIETSCEVTAIVESDWCFKSSDFPVSLEISGANSLTSSKSPDSSGIVSWTYKGEEAGTDTINVTWHIPDCSNRSRTGIFIDLQSTLEKSWTQSGITMEISPDTFCIDLESEKRVPCADSRKRMKGTRWLKLLVKIPDGLAFAATDVNMEKFTLEGVEPARGHLHIKDVDHDGKKDVLLSFWIPQMVKSGIFNVSSRAGPQSLNLKLSGETSDGTSITAKDINVKIVRRRP